MELLARLERIRDKTRDSYTTKTQLWFEIQDLIQDLTTEQIERISRDLRLERREREGLPT